MIMIYFTVFRLGTKAEATKAFERAVAAGDRYDSSIVIITMEEL